MATSSIVMLSNISMERLYLSQPPAWNDLQRLPFSIPQQTQSQQADGRTSQQVIRTCYDKLLHHIYDMNCSVSATTINQINEQLELAAEYCQLKTTSDKETIYLHSDRFFVQIKFDPMTRLPIHVMFSITNDQGANSEDTLVCPRMLKALNEKQYRLFRAHLNGFASLFTLGAPTMNNDKRIGYTAYKVLQQDLERLSKTEAYGKLLKGFQPMCEGLPMRIPLHEPAETNPSLPSHVRIVLLSSPGQHLLSVKSAVYIDDKTNQIHLDSSTMKSSLPATGHFALEIDENQSPFTLLLNYAQEIGRITNLNQHLSNTKTFQYLASLIPKTKLLNRYQWYISHDQSAISIRQIPFTNVKQLIPILNLLRQQIYLTKYLSFYFHPEYPKDAMDEEVSTDQGDIFLELSLLSSMILSITCAQSSHLSTLLLHMSNFETLPLLTHRNQQREVYLTEEKNSLIKLIEKFFHEENSIIDPSLSTGMLETSSSVLTTPQSIMKSASMPKMNRRLSCGPPPKPTWRSATTLRRNQLACLTLVPKDDLQEKIGDPQMTDGEMHRDTTTEESHDEEDNDDIFFSESQQPGNNQTQTHHLILPRPSLSFPSTLSRATSVSSTQSVSTPPIFGLTPSTPYPGGSNNPNGNVFFPIAKQVSVPDINPLSPPLTMGSFDPLAFLPTQPTANTVNQTASADMNIRNQLKKKRPRSEISSDEILPSMNPVPNERSSTLTSKMSPSGVDSSAVKRSKKPADKNSPTPAGQPQLVRQKSAFKVTDSSAPSLLSQTSVTSPDESPGELKSLKVVIKRVADAGNSSNDESQQQAIKQRKKVLSQQSLTSASGTMPSSGRKLTNTLSSGGSSSVVVKSESFDVSQFNSDPVANAMMVMNESGQQTPRERPRPSSSLANPSTTLSASAPPQPRSAPPQPPIVLKIPRPKVYSGQDSQTVIASSSTTAATTPTTATSTVISTAGVTGGVTPSSTIPNSLKEALKNRARPASTGVNTNKPTVTSPPLLAAKLTSPSTTSVTNPLATTTTVTPSFRIPKKSSSQDTTVKPKVEPMPVNNNPSPTLPKGSLLPTHGTANDLSKPINKVTTPNNVRPSPPSVPSQIGSWQSPPTQQPSRFHQHQHRPRSSWSQQQAPRGRTPVTPPNVAVLAGHPSAGPFSQQPRSILKKPSSNDPTGSDLLYMPSSDLSGFNEQRAGTNFSQPSSSLLPRSMTSPGMYDDNDDDTSPQAQLVIDTSNTTANNVLLPYATVHGSNASSAMDNFDPSHENHSMNTSSQQQQQQQQNSYNDDSSSLLD